MLLNENRDGILWLTMDRPPANALSNALLRELVPTLESAVADSKVRGVVLRGAGSRFFTAGGDVKEFATLSREGGLERVEYGSRLKAALGNLECPYVCAVNGAAIGSGMEMAALADFCVASETARFGMPEINHGLLPMAKGIQQLVRVIGLNNTKDVLFSGEIFDARKGLEIGLVHEIVPYDRLDERAGEWITAMASKPPELFRALKRTVNKCLFMSDAELEELTKEDLKSYFGAEESRIKREGYLEHQRSKSSG
jgi:enoyl-CoA hydratase/carnithine racemase